MNPWEILTHEWELSLLTDSVFNFHSEFTLHVAGCDFQYGPNFGLHSNPTFRFSWIFISWQSVLTTSHWFCKLLWELFSVMKYCPTSTSVRNPASVQNLITRFCCYSLSTRSWYFCNRSSCAGSSVECVGVFINELLGTNNVSDFPTRTGRPVLTWHDLYTSHKSETAP